MSDSGNGARTYALSTSKQQHVLRYVSTKEVFSESENRRRGDELALLRRRHEEETRRRIGSFEADELDRRRRIKAKVIEMLTYIGANARLDMEVRLSQLVDVFEEAGWCGLEDDELKRRFQTALTDARSSMFALKMEQDAQSPTKAGARTASQTVLALVKRLASRASRRA